METLSRVLPDAARVAESYPFQLSGGMAQRALIAMATALDPSIVIADEPTSSLDVAVRHEMITWLEQMRDDRDVAVLLITHDLGVVARFADRVAVMYAGRIVEEGDAGEIYAHPQHPYTYGLLNSVPRLDSARASNLIPIPGSPPDLVDLPPGCSFRPRCHIGRPNCEATIPELTGAVSGHQVACPYTAEISAETRI